VLDTKGPAIHTASDPRTEASHRSYRLFNPCLVRELSPWRRGLVTQDLWLEHVVWEKVSRTRTAGVVLLDLSDPQLLLEVRQR
jgi:hypothetical protein